MSAWNIRAESRRRARRRRRYPSAERVQIETHQPVAPAGQFDDQPAGSAGRLQQPAGREGAVLAARRHDEIGLQPRVRTEGDVVILRIVVPVFVERTCRCHGQTPFAGSGRRDAPVGLAAAGVYDTLIVFR